MLGRLDAAYVFNKAALVCAARASGSAGAAAFANRGSPPTMCCGMLVYRARVAVLFYISSPDTD